MKMTKGSMLVMTLTPHTIISIIMIFIATVLMGHLLLYHNLQYTPGFIKKKQRSGGKHGIF